MKQLQPVIWRKGTFLSPQHLQTQDRYLEDTLHFFTDSLVFRPWGFTRLQIDEEALAGGSVKVHQASGIMPDGLVFDIPATDPAPLPLPVEDCFGPETSEVSVYLSIPHQRERGLNVSPGGRDYDTRFVAEVTTLRDENTGMSEKPVQVARKNLRLTAGAQPGEGMSSLRLTRVRRTAAGAIEIDPAFVPPLLDIAASNYLMAIARRLVEILDARSSQLSGTRRQKNQTLADFGSSDIANFWLLYTINSAFPLFAHIFRTRHGHPAKLYEAMLSLAGSLTTFSTKTHPRDMPPYDHNDLSGCFTKLDETVRLLLDTVVPSNFITLPLKPVQPHIWATPLADDRYLQRTRLYLGVAADMNEAELIGRTPYLIKVCSASHIDHLVRNALAGVPLTHVSRPPSQLPVKLNYQYFSLSQGGGAWEAVVRSRNLAAYVPGDFPEPQLELVILLPEAS